MAVMVMYVHTVSKRVDKEGKKELGNEPSNGC